MKKLWKEDYNGKVLKLLLESIIEYLDKPSNYKLKNIKYFSLEYVFWRDTKKEKFYASWRYLNGELYFILNEYLKDEKIIEAIKSFMVELSKFKCKKLEYFFCWCKI